MRATEYEFTLPDGTRRYEIVEDIGDVWAFVKMHDAIVAKPVDHDTRKPQPR